MNDPWGPPVNLGSNTNTTFVEDAPAISVDELNSPLGEFRPTIRYDGLEIVFGSNRPGGQEIFIMSTDGENERQLTNDGFVDLMPQWRPGS